MSLAKTAETEQYIANYEHDDLFNAKQVTDVGSDKQIIIFAEATNVKYIGFGARGLATSADGWLIKKIDKSADPTTIKHAIGILDDKATLTYT